MWANYCNSMIRSFWGGFVYKHHHLGFFLTGTLVAITCWWSPSIHHPLSGRHLIISSSWASQTPLLRSYIHEPCLKFDYFQASAMFWIIFPRKNTNSNSKRISTGQVGVVVVTLSCFPALKANIFWMFDLKGSIFVLCHDAIVNIPRPPAWLVISASHFPPLKSSSHLWWSARQNLIGAYNLDGVPSMWRSNKLPCGSDLKMFEMCNFELQKGFRFRFLSVDKLIKLYSVF